jgi:hypothetical protein
MLGVFFGERHSKLHASAPRWRRRSSNRTTAAATAAVFRGIGLSSLKGQMVAAGVAAFWWVGGTGEERKS